MPIQSLPAATNLAGLKAPQPTNKIAANPLDQKLPDHR
jgi:hypothetical protein